MFGLFKFLKLNGILHECNILSGYPNRIDVDIVDKNRKMFDIRTEKGKENFKRVMQIVYESNPAAARMKLFIMVHRLMSRQASLAEYFLNLPKGQYQGIKILKRQNRSVAKNNDTSLKSADISTSSQANRSRGTSRHSVDQDILFDDVNVYLHIYLVIPYFNYLMKLCIHYDLYEQCKQNTKNQLQPNFILIWKLINLIKSLTPIRAVLTHIGRYYLMENLYIVDFLEAITRDINYYYRMIEYHIELALKNFTKSDKLSMENVLKVVEEMIELNESLFEIYYSRYFYKLIQHVKSPKWVTLTNEQIDSMIKLHRIKYGDGGQGDSKKNATMTLSHTRDRQRIACNFEEMNMSFGAI